MAIRTTLDIREKAGKLATGADIKTAKAGARLRFGNGLYLLVSGQGTKSWQVHYTVSGRHQATIIGRWPEFGIVEAKAKRDEIRRTVREGGDPAHDRHERRTARIDGDAATVRVIGEAWIAAAQVARGWCSNYSDQTTRRLANHVYPAIGDRPIGRVTTHEIEGLIVGMMKPTAARPAMRAQAVHVRQVLQSLFDYAKRRELVEVNPVRKIAEDLPTRTRGGELEASRAHVETIEEARRVLQAVEHSDAGPFIILAHRLIALTSVRKLEGVEARWSEITETADGMTWKIPAVRMKGRRGKKREHAIPLSPQAADVFRAARTLQAALGIRSDYVFPGQGARGNVSRSAVSGLMNRVLPKVGLAGRHTVHGWRSTFSTISNEADPGAYRVVDVMLAHKAFGEVEGRYNKATFLAERRRLASAWADALLVGAPSASALAGIVEAQDGSTVILWREAA